MNGLIEHLERHLGEIDCGWKDSDGTEWPFQIARFKGGPIANCFTYCTVGLSDFALPSSVSNKMIRHELFVMVRPAFGDKNLPAVLHQIGAECIPAQRPLLRGDVLGPRGKLITGTEFEAAYVSIPVYHPDSFASCRLCDHEQCVIVWLIPITAREARFVQQVGWRAFEKLLQEQDPDLLDFHRVSVQGT